MAKFEKLKTQMRELIDQLPQRSAIQNHVIEPWIEGVITLEPQRALWHVHRLRGFGGSEAGELLRFKHGEPFLFKSPEDIIHGKLLLSLPERGNIHTSRGTDLEEVVQRALWQHTGYTSLLDQPDMRKAFQKPRRDLPCAVGNPDDILNDTQGKLVIPDYKVRSTLDWDSDLEINYVAQCHWYAGLLEANQPGTKVDRLMLAELDIPNATADGMRDALKVLVGDERENALNRFASVINEMSLPGFGLRVTEFNYNLKLLEDLDAIAKTLWEQNVLKGHPLINEATSRQPLPDKERDRLRTLEADILKYKMLKDASDQSDNAICSEAHQILQEYDVSEWKGESTTVNLGYTKRFSSEKAALALIADGAEKSSLTKGISLDSVTGVDIDPDKAAIALRNHGLLNESVLKANWNPTAIKKELKQHETLNESMFTSTVPRTALSQTKNDKAFRASLSGKVNDALSSITILDVSAPLETEEETTELGSPSLA